MNGYLTLLAGLLLPWLVGTLWLALLENRFVRDSSPHRLRQLGYGFFLGYGVMSLVVLASGAWTGTVNWAWLMTILGVLAAAAAAMLWMCWQTRTLSVPVRRESFSAAHKVLLTVLAAWIGLHVALAAIENVSQPVYPWDAWTTWVYRARAWFLTGEMVDFARYSIWAREPSSGVYTMQGANYPLLPSVVPYWAALSLGRWSESLVNLPVLLAAVAMGMALYGQCRESGMSVLFSITACYLLSSVPLFATHISLAGYADFWVAGFSGLGFIALMRGATSRQRFQILLGFCMLGFAMMVKIEAAVWMLMGLFFLVVMTMRIRTVLAAMLALAAIGAGLFAAGISEVSVPLLGDVDFAEGQLQLTFLRPVEFEMNNVWGDYWSNFFTMGSWNLLWPLMLLALLLSVAGINRTSAGATGAGALFILIVLTAQILIFGFTDQGAYAAAYTAINRLPLQFTPGLIFAALLIVNGLAAGGGSASPEIDRRDV